MDEDAQQHVLVPSRVPGLVGGEHPGLAVQRPLDLERRDGEPGDGTADHRGPGPEVKSAGACCSIAAAASGMGPRTLLAHVPGGAPDPALTARPVDHGTSRGALEPHVRKLTDRAYSSGQYKPRSKAQGCDFR